MMKRQFAAVAAMPLFGAGLPIAIGNMYAAMQKDRVLSDIMDEYNIESAKRVVNM